MLSDFSWDMTGYIPKHAVNPHGDGIIPYAAERILYSSLVMRCEIGRASCRERVSSPV